jgi:hypothetical protein
MTMPFFRSTVFIPPAPVASLFVMNLYPPWKSVTGTVPCRQGFMEHQ